VTKCIACKKSDTSCNDTYCPFDIELVGLVEDPDYQILYKGEPQPTRKCTMKDGEDCIYVYYMTEQEIDKIRLVHAEREDLRDCPDPLNVVNIIIGIVVGIFAVGLAIVIAWSLLAQFAAYREYKAFEKETETANWSQTTSPLYQPATQKYTNPRYRKTADVS
jgi:hypothetical protein